MLLDHDSVYRLGILKGQETKSSGSSRVAVAHNSAFNNFAELAEVVPQGF